MGAPEKERSERSTWNMSSIYDKPAPVKSGAKKGGIDMIRYASGWNIHSENPSREKSWVKLESEDFWQGNVVAEVGSKDPPQHTDKIEQKNYFWNGVNDWGVGGGENTRRLEEKTMTRVYCDQII